MAITPNMQLNLPVVSVTPGPEYATQVNNSFTTIDLHDHSPGSGVQITPEGLNINSPLDIQNNGLFNVSYIDYTPVASHSTTASTYVIGDELYYRDGAGNQVQITLGGSVNAGAGTITGLPSGTASAAFDAIGEKFVFKSATNVAAFIDAGPYIMRNHTAGSLSVTVQPPTTIGADYTLTLPPLPVSKKLVTLSTSGAIVGDTDVDNSTIEISSNNLRVKALGITSAELAANSVTTVKILDQNVTTAKIADASISNVKMANNAILPQNVTPTNNVDALDFNAATVSVTTDVSVSFPITPQGVVGTLGTIKMMFCSLSASQIGGTITNGFFATQSGNSAALEWLINGVVVERFTFAGNFVPFGSFNYIARLPPGNAYTIGVRIVPSTGTVSWTAGKLKIEQVI